MLVARVRLRGPADAGRARRNASYLRTGPLSPGIAPVVSPGATGLRQEEPGAMIILRFKIRSKPEWSDEVMAPLAEIVPTARATEGVINFDIARVLRDPDAFIATAVYEDGAALERQES